MLQALLCTVHCTISAVYRADMESVTDAQTLSAKKSPHTKFNPLALVSRTVKHTVKYTVQYTVD